MLILESIAKIRRAFFVQGKSIKLICRELRVSRKVVRKVIRSEATEFRYEREAQPLPKIGPHSFLLSVRHSHGPLGGMSNPVTRRVAQKIRGNHSLRKQSPYRRDSGPEIAT